MNLHDLRKKKMSSGMNGGGIDFAAIRRAEAMAKAAAKQPQPMVIAQPLNDAQLLCLMACKLQGSAQERVKFSIEVMTEVMKQMKAQVPQE